MIDSDIIFLSYGQNVNLIYAQMLKVLPDIKTTIVVVTTH